MECSMYMIEKLKNIYFHTYRYVLNESYSHNHIKTLHATFAKEMNERTNKKKGIISHCLVKQPNVVNLLLVVPCQLL